MSLDSLPGRTPCASLTTLTMLFGKIYDNSRHAVWQNLPNSMARVVNEAHGEELKSMSKEHMSILSLPYPAPPQGRLSLPAQYLLMGWEAEIVTSI